MEGQYGTESTRQKPSESARTAAAAMGEPAVPPLGVTRL